MFVTDNIRFCYQSKQKVLSQTLPDECKHEITRNKVENLINDDLHSSSSDESDSEFDNISGNGSDHDKSND